jgi:hypothetical protein
MVEQVVREGAASPDPNGDPVIVTTYCFINLPPVMGGQVTLDRAGDEVITPRLDLANRDGCPVRVQIYAKEPFPTSVAASFHILLY